jgi:secreted Zn-dependent insulinase-like peptidase
LYRYVEGGSKPRVDAAIAAGEKDPLAIAAAAVPLVTPPEIIHECGAMRLWHRLDDKFDQPRMNAYFHVNLPAIEPTPEAYILADMLTLLVHDRLQDLVRYPAELASLHAGLDVVGQHTMLSLTFDGFNDKLPKLVEAYFAAVADFDVNDTRFEKIKEKRVKDLKNYGLKPGRQAHSLLHELLKEREDSEAAKLAALEKCTAQMLRDFAAAVWSSASHVEGLIIGNVTAEEALAMGAMIRGTLKGGPIAPDAFPTRRVTKIPRGDTRFALSTQNPEEGTNVVYVHFQHGVSTYALRATLLMVHQLMGEKLFDQLRTKEQLGYVASASLETLYDVQGFRVTVESAFHAPAFVEGRINAFLAGFPAQVTAMTEEEYVKTRRSLVDSVLTMDVSLSAEADRHWTHVSNQKYQFYRGQIIASEINKCSREQVVEWLKGNLVPGVESARKVTIFVHGKNHPLGEPGAGVVAAAAAPPPPPPMGLADVPRLKVEWGMHPNQGTPTVVPALEMPPEDICKMSNTNVAELQSKVAAVVAAAAAAAGGEGGGGGGAGGKASRSNQWAQRLAERRAQCAAGCACLKPASGGPFKMPRLKK